MGRSWRILSRCCICLYPMCLLGPVISVLSISWYTIEKKTKQNKTKELPSLVSLEYDKKKAIHGIYSPTLHLKFLSVTLAHGV